MTSPRSPDEPPATRALSDFAVNLKADDIPAAVRRRASHLVLDAVGCGLAGSRTAAGAISVRWVEGLGGSPAASLFASPVRSGPALAACANARMIGALDADETFPCDGQISHHGAATFSTALALGEETQATGAELLTAFAVGYEVGARLSLAMIPPDRGQGLRGGWGPGGTIAAALTAARLRGLGPQAAAHAAGLAGMHIDGPTLQWAEAEPAPLIKSADGGWHAMTGVLSAELAAHGMTGYDRILDGHDGLWRALGYASCDYDAMLGGLGSEWQLMNASFKAWPCQYWMQQPLTALAEVIRRHGRDIRPAEVHRVLIRTNARSNGDRFHQRDPRSEVDRSFSIPHAVAMMITDVPAGPRWIDDEVARQPLVRQLRQRVDVELHPDAAGYRGQMTDRIVRHIPAGATVWTSHDVFEAEVGHAMGNPWDDATRLSEDDLVDKLRRMAEGVGAGTPWSPDIDQLVGVLTHLDDLEHVGALTGLLAPRDCPQPEPSATASP